MVTQLEKQARIAVLDQPERVHAVLSPLRRELLEALRKADSATGLAKRMGLPRQKLNYHLRELERAGLISCVEERPRRGCVERRYRVTAESYVVSPEFLGKLGADPARLQDRFSSAYLIALASQTVRDVAVLRDRAAAVDKTLTTLSVEAEVAFASPAELTEFAEELSGAVAALVAKYDKPNATIGRVYRFALGAYPKVTKSEDQARAEARTAARESAKRSGQD